MSRNSETPARRLTPAERAELPSVRGTQRLLRRRVSGDGPDVRIEAT